MTKLGKSLMRYRSRSSCALNELKVLLRIYLFTCGLMMIFRRSCQMQSQIC